MFFIIEYIFLETLNSIGETSNKYKKDKCIISSHCNNKTSYSNDYIFRFIKQERYKEIQDSIISDKLIKFGTFIKIFDKSYTVYGFYKENGNVLYFDHECVSKVEE